MQTIMALGRRRRVLGALLAKNWTTKRRQPVATWSEVMNPLLCILLFASLKSLDPDLEIPSGWATNAVNETAPAHGSTWNLYSSSSTAEMLDEGLSNAGVTIPEASSGSSSGGNSTLDTAGLLQSLSSTLQIPRFYFTEATMPGFLLSMSLQAILEADRLDELSQDDLQTCALQFLLFGYTGDSGTSYHVPNACQGKIVPYKVAITPDTAYTRAYFASAMEQWHPRIALTPSVQGITLLTTPSFADSHVFFDNEMALENYLASEQYGKDLAHPKVIAAVAFEEFPEEVADFGDIKGHSIAYSLRFNTTRGYTSSAPSLMNYATRGFMTLQTTVARFLNCMPTWDSQLQTTNGTCQIRQAVMPADPDTDHRLLRQVENDMIISSAFKLLGALQGLVGENLSVNLSALSVDSIPSLSKKKLLASLRMAPQPFHGAGVYASPRQGFRYAIFFDQVALVFPIVFVLSYLYTVSRVIVSLLMEKETQSRELMRILGAQDGDMLAGWMLIYLQILVLGAFLQTVGSCAWLFPNSDMGLLFAFFFTFATSSFAYAFLVSSVFSRARSGSFVGMGAFFMMFLVSFSFNDQTSEAARTAACLLPPVSLSQGISVVARLEAFHIGVSAQNASELVNNFRFSSAIWMQVLNTFLYLLLGKYLEKVVPQEFGVAEKWYFFLTKAYWMPRSSSIISTEREMKKDAIAITTDTGDIEAVANDLRYQETEKRAVIIEGLRKEFSVPGGTKVAVHGLDLKLYEGQITCLLGHNGAGKTTVMSMLTGMTSPSSGTVWIRGHSIITDMQTIRQSLGYCPQHSVLYPSLTVLEHLQLYARIKGLTDGTGLAVEVDKKIREVGLSDKRHVRAHALSGGMQRKLSLAIAFLGDSTVVFLDEPTAGMDPYSRRSTWELIQHNRAGRVVILTTHFMDEADILGDRIAIMVAGRLKCIGSSLFLKKRFGVGYRLSFVRKERDAMDDTERRRDGSDSTSNIAALIQYHVPQAVMSSDIGAELTFQLPFEASPSFPALFRELEHRQGELDVLSFAISVTTLEEIFLKVAESGDGTGDATDQKKRLRGADSRVDGVSPQMRSLETALAVKSADQDEELASWHPTSQTGRQRISGTRAYVSQVSALLRKRALSGKRDLNMLFFSMVLPIIIVFMGLSALKLSTLLQNDPKLNLSFRKMYWRAEKTPVPFSCPHGDKSGDSTWCSDLFQSGYFSEGIPYEIAVEQTVYNASMEPTVFGVTYNSPAIEPNDTSGLCLRFGELVFEKSYGFASDTAAPYTPTQTPIEEQFGGFLVYASEDTHTMSYNVMANSSSIHAAPTYKAMIDEAIHRMLLAEASGDETGVPNVTIRVASHPLPLSLSSQSIFSSYLSFPAVISVVIAFTFIPASMMPYLVKEKQREQNAKHQQLLSGVSLTAYWMANFVFDFALYLVPMALTILLIRWYGISSSLSGAKTCDSCTQDVPAAMITLFMLFGAAVAPWTYLLSHLMKQPGASLLYTAIINFVVGILLLILSFAMNSLDSTREVNTMLSYIWRFSPLFAFGNGLLSVIMADLLALFGLSSVPRSAFDADIAGTDILYLLLQCPIFFMLTVTIDYMRAGTVRWRLFTFGAKLGRVRHSYQRLPCAGGKLEAQESVDINNDQRVEEDEAVAAEAQRVNLRDPSPGRDSGGSSSEVIRIQNLQLIYPNGKRAVKSLSFGLQQGECFGFLGVNGAGKTTTMKVLTGDLLPSAGTAILNGFDIRKNRARARESIGYCPQFDALIDLLTVREHLELYGRLKGFTSPSNLRGEVNRLLAKLQIQEFAGKLAGTLSGGNKRKLSLAIAMLGSPSVLVLDEPSTGVDPFSRRMLWDVILEASVHSRQSTVMLTTHSMEECEALCSKAGIMVDGSLKCFGSVPHIKSRYGNGFVFECKLEAPHIELLTNLEQDVRLHLGGALNQGKEGDVIPVLMVEKICVALGKPERAKSITLGNGTTLDPSSAASLLRLDHRSGTLDVALFCEWWLLEDQMQRLDEFLRSKFSDVMLIERQVDFYCYKLSGAHNRHIHDDDNSANESIDKTNAVREAKAATTTLSRTFEIVEGAQKALGIKEYSLTQTSLEQIFNAFAHQCSGASS